MGVGTKPTAAASRAAWHRSLGGRGAHVPPAAAPAKRKKRAKLRRQAQQLLPRRPALEAPGTGEKLCLPPGRDPKEWAQVAESFSPSQAGKEESTQIDGRVPGGTPCLAHTPLYFLYLGGGAAVLEGPSLRYQHASPISRSKPK